MKIFCVIYPAIEAPVSYFFDRRDAEAACNHHFRDYVAEFDYDGTWDQFVAVKMKEER